MLILSLCESSSSWTVMMTRGSLTETFTTAILCKSSSMLTKKMTSTRFETTSLMNTSTSCTVGSGSWIKITTSLLIRKTSLAMRVMPSAGKPWNEYSNRCHESSARTGLVR